ncbi:hypothetical protein, conserved [Plasmodium gonderi]|uniref:Uncharacterized protein n=1 Tax=Plasmodium gonderi TaxID=77519 RepID=A0A1Y1JHW1_PLAGO|nr:hypothetical protein, conserved [Plasmodium gonderi]GAW80023.1 hypothetical protein, conserved [Plasmodium gonderi]
MLCNKNVKLLILRNIILPNKRRNGQCHFYFEYSTNVENKYTEKENKSFNETWKTLIRNDYITRIVNIFEKANDTSAKCGRAIDRNCCCYFVLGAQGVGKRFFIQKSKDIFLKKKHLGGANNQHGFPNSSKLQEGRKNVFFEYDFKDTSEDGMIIPFPMKLHALEEFLKFKLLKEINDDIENKKINLKDIYEQFILREGENTENSIFSKFPFVFKHILNNPQMYDYLNDEDRKNIEMEIKLLETKKYHYENFAAFLNILLLKLNVKCFSKHLNEFSAFLYFLKILAECEEYEYYMKNSKGILTDFSNGLYIYHYFLSLITFLQRTYKYNFCFIFYNFHSFLLSPHPARNFYFFTKWCEQNVAKHNIPIITHSIKNIEMMKSIYIYNNVVLHYISKYTTNLSLNEYSHDMVNIDLNDKEKNNPPPRNDNCSSNVCKKMLKENFPPYEHRRNENDSNHMNRSGEKNMYSQNGVNNKVPGKTPLPLTGKNQHENGNLHNEGIRVNEFPDNNFPHNNFSNNNFPHKNFSHKNFPHNNLPHNLYNAFVEKDLQNYDLIRQNLIEINDLSYDMVRCLIIPNFAKDEKVAKCIYNIIGGNAHLIKTVCKGLYDLNNQFNEIKMWKEIENEKKRNITYDMDEENEANTSNNTIDEIIQHRKFEKQKLFLKNIHEHVLHTFILDFERKIRNFFSLPNIEQMKKNANSIKKDGEKGKGEDYASSQGSKKYIENEIPKKGLTYIQFYFTIFEVIKYFIKKKKVFCKNIINLNNPILLGLIDVHIIHYNYENKYLELSNQFYEVLLLNYIEFKYKQFPLKYKAQYNFNYILNYKIIQHEYNLLESQA